MDSDTINAFGEPTLTDFINLLSALEPYVSISEKDIILQFKSLYETYATYKDIMDSLGPDFFQSFLNNDAL